MHDFKCNPEMEISGQTLQAYVNNVQADIIRPIFRKYRMLPDIESKKWYPLQPVLDVLKELSKSSNATTNLVAIGVKIAEYGVEPEDIIEAPLPVVLEHWQDHMDISFRNGDPGKIITEKVHDKFYKVTQINLFPDDFCYGLAYGFARSRLPLGTNFKVWYEEGVNRIDDGGGDKTVICVEWE
jgi:hypothetical protein